MQSRQVRACGGEVSARGLRRRAGSGSGVFGGGAGLGPFRGIIVLFVKQVHLQKEVGAAAEG